MKTEKYKLDKTDTISVKGHKLYRIISLVDMTFVSKGEKGGYIEKESNLSQEGNAWVGDNAWVFGDACVYGDACVSGNAQVFDVAQVCMDARIHGLAQVYENARVYGNACVSGSAKIFNYAQVFGESIVDEMAKIYGNAYVYGCAKVYGGAQVYGYTRVNGNARISDDANICWTDEYFCVQSFGSCNRTTTFFRTKDCWLVNCGCFKGTVEQFRKAVVKTHGNSLIAKEYMMIADLAELRIDRCEKIYQEK